MRDFITQLHDRLGPFVPPPKANSVFREISDCFYRENFHSDLIAAYLANEEVMHRFVEWMLNDRPCHLFKGDLVERESGKIDIIIFDKSKKRAIVIENKSNGAIDQPRQLYRYLESLRTRGVTVISILYLNLRGTKWPDLTDLNPKEKEVITEILKVTDLSGFTENVIDEVLAETDSVRLAGVSHEIKSLFKILTYEKMNTQKLIELSRLLNEDEGRGERQLKELIEAYRLIPNAFAEYLRAYISTEKNIKHWRIWVYNGYCLVIDDIKLGGKYFAIDINFSTSRIDFSFLIRPNHGDENDVINLKQRAGDLFPFNTYENGRHRFHLDGGLNIESATDEVNKLINTIENLQSRLRLQSSTG